VAVNRPVRREKGGRLRTFEVQASSPDRVKASIVIEWWFVAGRDNYGCGSEARRYRGPV
jgi:hypothetical protein